MIQPGQRAPCGEPLRPLELPGGPDFAKLDDRAFEVKIPLPMITAAGRAIGRGIKRLFSRNKTDSRSQPTCES